MAHDTATLIRDLLARMVRMEAKVETAEENRTEPEKRDEEIQALEGLAENELIHDLLARMVEVEAKVKTAEENRTEPEEKGEEKQALEELVGEMEGKLGELMNELQMERYLGKKRDDEIGALTNKIRKMEEEQTSKQADKMEKKNLKNRKEEERKNEIRTAKDELSRIKEEMASMKSEEVRRKDEMMEKLNNMRTQREAENKERGRLEHPP